MNYQSNIKGDLRKRNFYRTYGRKLEIAFVTSIVFFPICCIAYDQFYPPNLISFNHRQEFIKEIISNIK